MIDKTMCEGLWRNISDFYVDLRVEVGKHPQVIWIYFDKILVSEYKLFKRSNKANLFIALVQYPVSQMKMTFQEIRIIATGPCIAKYKDKQVKNVKDIFYCQCVT
jgi:hypothetical protein